jgi:uncharacterized peroxidase-related enzyme
MSWIKTIPPEEATGLLRQEYGAAVKRAGRIYNIVRIMSLNPRTLRASMELYKSLMHAPSKLSRAQREMIAVVVSKTNDCYY